MLVKHVAKKIKKCACRTDRIMPQDNNTAYKQQNRVKNLHKKIDSRRLRKLR